MTTRKASITSTTTNGGGGGVKGMTHDADGSQLQPSSFHRCGSRCATVITCSTTTTTTTMMMMMIMCICWSLQSVSTITAFTSTSNTVTKRYRLNDASSTQSSKLYAQPEDQSRSPSFSLLPNLLPKRSEDNTNDDDDDTTLRPPPEQFTSSYVYDGTTNDGLILHAKYFIQQTDCGLLDPTILLSDPSTVEDIAAGRTIYEDRFQYINAQLEIPLSKTDYITAGRYFNLRNTFPDFNYRPYDFRIVNNNNNNNANIVTIRCTCRCTGTMRGELRLRNNLILAPTGITMRCPPEAMTISIQRNTGKVIQLCTGFVMDRCIGNTQGTTGVTAASIIAGEDVSVWDMYPPVTILRNIIARPIPPIRESPTTVSPFPESVMIQLAKGILSSQMAYNDPTLLSDTTFTYSTPTIGPITKSDFVKSYAQQEFPPPLQPIFNNFRIDPYDPVRVWVDVVLTVPTDNFISPPQAMSFSFDENGYCTRITSQAVMDLSPLPDTAGGLGGYEGYQYHIGQASPGIFTRPISRSLERLRLRIISPLTGINVDEYHLPKPRKNIFEIFSSSTTTVKPTIKKPEPPPNPPTSAVLVENSEVVKRLESLKEFTSSIRIIPPSLSENKDSSKGTRPTTSTSGTAQERLARATKATEQSKLMIEKAKREAAALQKKIALAEANAAKQKIQQQKQATIKAKQLEAAKEAAARQKQQQQATLAQKQLQQKKAAEVARKKQEAATIAAQKAAEVARQKEQLAMEKRRKEEERERQQRAAAAAAEAEVRQRELEAQRIAEAAAREAKKVQLMKEQLAAAEARARRELSSSTSTTAIKAKNAAERIATTPTKKSPSVPIQRTATPSRSVYTTKGLDGTSSNILPAFNGLARATISLFGLGKSELEELPAPKVQTPSSSTSKGGSRTTPSRRAPTGVPTVTRWRQNADQTITGLVQGSRNFDDGSRITTSPITSGTIASGEVVRTGSGSRYFLE
jgi:hypothetical protein